MAYRKRVPQPRPCVVCGNFFLTAHQRGLYCSGTCNTRAWRRRHPDASRSSASTMPTTKERASKSTATSPVNVESADALGQPAVTGQVAATSQPSGPSFGKMVLANTLGTLFADTIKHLVAPAAPAPAAPPSGLPSWPPPTLLAAAGPLEPITLLGWPALTGVALVSYQRHRLYLCLVGELTWVLWQSPLGEWYRLTTPADLAWLAARPPRSPRLQAMILAHEPAFYVPPFARVEALLEPPTEPT